MAKRERRRALLDSCAWLSVIKGEPTAGLVQQLLAQAESGGVELWGSTMLLAEIYKPSNDSAEQTKQQQVLRMLKSQEFNLVDVSSRIAQEAGQLRLNRPSLRAPDAVHLATAKVVGADWFVTMDQALVRDAPQLMGTRIIVLKNETRERDLPWATAVQDPLPAIHRAL